MIKLKYPVVIISPSVPSWSKSYASDGKSFGIKYIGLRNKRACIDVEKRADMPGFDFLDAYLCRGSG